MYIYIYMPFFFGAVMALGILLCIDCLMAAWHTLWPHVWFWLARGSCFRWKPFQVSRIFQGKEPFDIYLSSFFFLFSCYFFTFSLRLAFLTSLVVHFALSLLSLLLRLLPIHFMPLKKNVLWKLRFLASSKIDFSFFRGQGSSSQKGWEGLCLCSWGSLFLWGCIFMWP